MAGPLQCHRLMEAIVHAKPQARHRFTGQGFPLDELVRAIQAGFCGEAPQIEDVAAELGMSARTLRRRLHQQGTTYREVVDDARRRVALSTLEATLEAAPPLRELAFRLGFSHSSALCRAFRRWTGATPMRFRSSLALARP